MRLLIKFDSVHWAIWLTRSSSRFCSLISYLQLYSPAWCRHVAPPVELILVLVLMRLQLLVSRLILVLVVVMVLVVLQVQAAFLVQVVPGHELSSIAGTALGQLVHAVAKSRGWRGKHH